MKLERFTWSHWIRKYLFYYGYEFRPRPQAGPDAPQLSQTSPRKNGKPSISRMAQKIELIIRLFSGSTSAFSAQLSLVSGRNWTKNNRMSMKCLRPFIDLPARLIKTDQEQKYSISVFLSHLDEIWHWGCKWTKNNIE